MDNPIVSTKIRGVRPSGERIEIELLIGKPYLNQSEPREQWRCPVSFKPLYNSEMNLAGADPLQALCIAIQIGVSQLQSFKDHGGQLLHDDGTELSLEAYDLSNGPDNA